MVDYSNRLIYGKNPTERIVSIEAMDDTLEIIQQDENGNITSSYATNRYWILSQRRFDDTWIKLEGNLHYKYGKPYRNRQDFEADRKALRKYNVYSVYDPREAIMLRDGYTYYKGMSPKDVTILSFDIESYGLLSNERKEVYIIANTYRKCGIVNRKLFSVDDYDSEADMIEDWCRFVRTIDPSIITGHNIFGYDLPYLAAVADKHGKDIDIGRDGSPLNFNNYESKYRVDGSQEWTYRNCRAYGREIIDTMFLSVKYDIGRDFPSWKLKEIIAHLGLEVEGRQHYDASTIKDNWHIPEEREKIKRYAQFDGDDALALFDLMIPSYFYMAQSIPKPFQKLINSASGSWLNNLFVRAYLQDKHSIPQASPPVEFEGAISYGVPGIYHNAYKQDVASLYPSIMRQYKIHDRIKDPMGYFTEVVEYFTIERLKNKQLAKETGNEYYKDLEQSQKQGINSLYGFMGASGLNFNSPNNAAKVTEYGRKILNDALMFATGEIIDYWKGDKVNLHRGTYKLVNCDTDSIMICKNDESPWTQEEKDKFLTDLNNLFPDLISWEDDGYYDSVIIIKAKNYVLRDAKTGKIKMKGSSITDSKKEPALKEMLDKMLMDLLNTKGKNLVDIYHSYIIEAKNITNISRWCVKKNISKKVLNASRTNEQKVLDALNGEDFQEGDKVYMFSDIDGDIPMLDSDGNPMYNKRTGELRTEPNRILRQISDYCGTYDKSHYIKRVYKTVEILKTVVDMSLFLNYDLVKNREALALLGENDD